MKNGFTETYPEFMGTNAVIPCLMEAVGYKHRDRQSRKIKRRIDNQVFLFSFPTRHILKPFLAQLGMGYMALPAPAASSNSVTQIC